MSASQPYGQPTYPGSSQPYGSPAYPGSPQPYDAAPAPVAADPGRTLGVVGLVLSFVVSAVGLVVSVIAYRRSKRAGHKNGIALAGIVVGAVVTAVYVVGFTVGGIALGGVAAKCAELGPGTHQVGGTTYTCG